MLLDDKRTELERELTARLTAVEKEMAALEAQKLTLQQLLLKVRRENFRLRDVTRKNSFDRILIENRILEALRSSNKPVAAKRLYFAIRDLNSRLPGSTFRSYLHRLKSRGLITNGETPGEWRLTEKGEKSAPVTADIV